MNRNLLPFGLFVVAMTGVGACRKSSPGPAMDENARPLPDRAAPAPSGDPQTPVPESPRMPIPIVNPPPVSWVVVENEREGTPGGYATGAFDRSLNKITVVTKDVQRFLLDTGAIAVDWSRPVVLNIDKKNYELRRRKDPAMRFDRNPHGEWLVLEP